MTHPTTRTWELPPDARPPLPGLARTNLRALAAREGRFEHHLVVVAKIGDVQLEHATASEPLYFSHANVSDEYAMPLTTGDAMLDAFPFRVFFSDPATNEDAGRIAHRAGDLVLHPYGLLHWPGKLRAPFEPPAFPPGARRCVHSLVMCASRPTLPVERPLFVAPGRESDAKSARPQAPPFLLAPIASSALGVVARVGDASLEIAEPPFAPERGGYVAVIEGSEPSFACDLVYVPPGARYDGAGVRRALVFSSSAAEPDPPPPSWERVPVAPFDLEARGSLPWSEANVRISERSDREVEVAIGESTAPIPRYWLARMLFRLALHGYALGYVETYGGLYYDDRGASVRVGLRGGESVEVARDRIAPMVEAMYRAVAPPGYSEDLR
jgi:hypothetical protein